MNTVHCNGSLDAFTEPQRSVEGRANFVAFSFCFLRENETTPIHMPSQVECYVSYCMGVKRRCFLQCFRPTVVRQLRLLIHPNRVRSRKSTLALGEHPNLCCIWIPSKTTEPAEQTEIQKQHKNLQLTIR